MSIKSSGIPKANWTHKTVCGELYQHNCLDPYKESAGNQVYTLTGLQGLKPSANQQPDYACSLGSWIVLEVCFLLLFVRVGYWQLEGILQMQLFIFLALVQTHIHTLRLPKCLTTAQPGIESKSLVVTVEGGDAYHWVISGFTCRWRLQMQWYDLWRHARIWSFKTIYGFEGLVEIKISCWPRWMVQGFRNDDDDYHQVGIWGVCKLWVTCLCTFSLKPVLWSLYGPFSRGIIWEVKWEWQELLMQ